MINLAKFYNNNKDIVKTFPIMDDSMVNVFIMNIFMNLIVYLMERLLVNIWVVLIQEIYQVITRV